MILVQIELRLFLIVQIMQPVVIILIAHLKLVGGVVILVMPLPVVRVLRSVHQAVPTGIDKGRLVTMLVFRNVRELVVRAFMYKDKIVGR